MRLMMVIALVLSVINLGLFAWQVWPEDSDKPPRYSPVRVSPFTPNDTKERNWGKEMDDQFRQRELDERLRCLDEKIGRESRGLVLPC